VSADDVVDPDAVLARDVVEVWSQIGATIANRNLDEARGRHLVFMQVGENAVERRHESFVRRTILLITGDERRIVMKGDARECGNLIGNAGKRASVEQRGDRAYSTIRHLINRVPKGDHDATIAQRRKMHFGALSV